MYGAKKREHFLHEKFVLFIFPGCLGDTQFCFRFRQGSNRKSSLGCFLETTDRDAPPCLKVCRHLRDSARDGIHCSVFASDLVNVCVLCACFRGNRVTTMVTCTSVRCGTSPWREDISRRSVTLAAAKPANHISSCLLSSGVCMWNKTLWYWSRCKLSSSWPGFLSPFF